MAQLTTIAEDDDIIQKMMDSAHVTADELKLQLLNEKDVKAAEAEKKGMLNGPYLVHLKLTKPRLSRTNIEEVF